MMSIPSGLNTRGWRGSPRGIQSVRGFRGRGRGRGDGEGHSGGSQSSRGWRGRGRGQGDGEVHGEGSHTYGFSSGRGRGRGRGGWVTDEEKTQIVTTQRAATIQVSSEGTDGVIVAASADEQLQHIASFILRKEDFTNFHTQSQIRRFVNSCLINLSNHHRVDTSGILAGLTSTLGRARLNEIMEKPMDVDVGGDKNILSFQFVILPLVGVLTRESVCQSVMTSESSAIYVMVYLNRQHFLEDGVMRCMDVLLDRGSLQDRSLAGRKLPREDPSVCQVSSLKHAMLAITRLIYQLIKRNRDARFEMVDIVRRLRTQQEKCLNVGTDSPESSFIKEVLIREVKRLVQIINDAQETIIQPADQSVGLEGGQLSQMHSPNRVHLDMIYDPPGNLSPSGPRHDNDFQSITAIQVLPTQKEITSSRTPFLPSNGIPLAPHFLPPGWRRQLDIHFRLYREDMLNPLRKGVMGFLSALEATDKGDEEVLLRPKDLRKLLNDNVSLNVYGNVEFLGMDTTKQSVGSIQISFDQPSQIQGTNHNRRTEFWQRSKSRLMQGALVCIARRSTNEDYDGEDTDVSATSFEMILAVVFRRNTDDLARNSSVAHMHISLTDSNMYLVMLNSMTHAGGEPWFLVESTGGFFESYRPVLKALQNCEPASMPFGKYLAPTKEETEARLENGGAIDPPLYSRAPGFMFDLSVLLKGQRFYLDVADQRSSAGAVEILQEHSTLDDTQAKALVETLCREVSLISGPPGTGKTTIGVDLMRVLLHNGPNMNCGPILCICYTNHALDQFLEHILDEGIRKIVRIGARSKSERLQHYTLDSLMKSRENSIGVKQALWEAFSGLDGIRVKIEGLEKSLRSDIPGWEFVKPYLLVNNPDQYDQFVNWTHFVRGEEIENEANSEYLDSNTDEDFSDGSYEDDGSLDDDDDDDISSDIISKDDGASNVNDQDEQSDEGVFTEVGGRSSTSNDPFTRWALGLDLKELKKSNEKAQNEWDERDSKSDHNPYNSLRKSHQRLKQGPILRHIPDTDRPLVLLNGNVWEMSIQERRLLLKSWKSEIQPFMMDKMEQLLKSMESFTQAKNDAFDESRRTILRDSLVIGMTTNGAAKLQTMISAVAPKIIICEEAGEVLESHILSALSVSTQHLILIGDHLQLRPQIETYALSSDSPVGRNHNLDQSLFERLVTAKAVPLSHLTIQRRMRPEISNLIRKTLYPDLEDGDKVREYPPVSGMGASLYFMDHAHPEDSKDQYGIQSFANTFEVKMVEALTHYLIKNGYDKPGDIAVLTPYLGQLSKLRDCLKKSFILVIDERDQEQLDLKDEEMEQNDMTSKANKQAGVKKLDLQNHIMLRTIDNYQGEEAKIVIISLVRSDVKRDGSLAGSSTIGFLKSPNRTNVLLSRAQHGMYIIGNAGLMDKEKHGIWPGVIKELRDFDQIGDGIPIMCKNHPEMQNIVDSPDTLRMVAPNNGCTNICGHNMPCGHVCPLYCHPDDNNHLLVNCLQPCPRLHRGCDHVCPKLCGEKCGNCMEPVAAIVLACGHVYEHPTCYEAHNPSMVICRVSAIQKLPTCEHEHILKCYMDPATFKCTKPCGTILDCGHNCTRACSSCKEASCRELDIVDGLDIIDATTREIRRTVHGVCLTQCGRNHFCGHACASICHESSPCSPCSQKCEVACAHFRCQSPCDEPCAACCQPCVWECEHEGKCNMPCGAPCDRLPCSERCGKVLSCGHQCPSVCGEKCPSKKFCVECGDPEIMDDIVDVVMQQPLCKVDVNDDPILVLSCGHVLTMTSLDGMMEMSSYYRDRTDRMTGVVSYVGKKELPGAEVSQVSCHLCRKPIVGLHRYGRRINYAQLSLRLKKYQVKEAMSMKDACQKFDTIQASTNHNQAVFLDFLSKVNAPPMAELRSKRSRRLGVYKNHTDLLPYSGFEAISKIYGIPEEQEEAWNELIKPATSCFMRFTSIHKNAYKSPSKKLFDAAVSHLYRLKTASTYDQSGGVVSQPSLPVGGTTSSEIVKACIVECGLPRDGHGGSSFVDSLNELTNVLLLVLAQAIPAMNKVGISTGWYWFVQDLIHCATLYVTKLKEATQNGKFDRKLAYARMTHMDLICKATQLKGQKDAFPTKENEQRARLKEVDYLMEQFMIEMREVKDRCPLGIKEECLTRIQVLEGKMTVATKIARGEIPSNGPLSYQERLELFRAVNEELHGEGHWYRCPNGHTYVIGECGGAMQESNCPECGAVIGGTHHNLRGDNMHDTEFENMYQQYRAATFL